MEQLTEAEVADQAVRRHLAAMVLVTHEGGDADVARLARSEMCRLVSAICSALSLHRLDNRGNCRICAATSCVLRGIVRRALLPIRLS
jgi:hypothetical protein